MATIDDKVVAMSFESRKFEDGVARTIEALAKLKTALSFPNAGKGLEGINSQLKKIDLGHISRGVDGIQRKLGAFSVAALAVFSSVAIKAVSTGAQVVKSLSLDPVLSGYQEYATNLNSIQTILANTQVSGAGLKEVNAALLELNKYSDKTIYNFSQMARNIGTFTAAGVDLKTSTASIKGIANLAALSGSNAEQASTAMYQLSQAISAGSVKLMDWNSVVNAGMGGTVFQRALAQTAEQMGKIKKGAVELKGPMKNVTISGESFRNSLSVPGKDSWLTSDVLTKTLQQFTGDLTDAQLKAEGFNDAQIKAIQQTAQTAMHAATEVKTLTQVFDVAKETAGSGWAQTFQIIFGNFNEAKKTFTDLSETINGFINANADARNKVLAHWKVLGGRVVLIAAIKQTFEALLNIIKPIKDAFRDIFPAATGRSLFELTKRFEDFSRALMPSSKTMANLRLTFQGVFSVFSIGVQVVKGLVGMFKDLFSSLGGGDGGFLSFTANIGKWLKHVDEALKKGGQLTKFFDALAKGLSVPLKGIISLGKALADLFGKIFSGGGVDAAGTQMTAFGKIISGVEKIISGFIGVFQKFVSALTGGGNAPDFSSGIQALIDGIKSLGPALGEAAANLDFEPILSAIRTGLLAALYLTFKKFLGQGAFADQLGREVGKNVSGLGGSILQNISGTFKALEGNLVSMQTNVKSKTLKQIAIAVALLAGSMLVLSLIDPKRLASSLTAMTVAFADLVGAMALLTIITKGGGFVKLPFIAASLIGLAVAIDFLAIAMLALSSLSWQEIAKGLTAVAGLLVIISAASVPLSKNSAGMIRAGIGITAMAIGLNILALAMKQFASMKWEEIGKGLAAVAGALVIIAATMKAMPTAGMVLTGAGLIAVAIALKVIADVVEDFSGMDWKPMGKGLAGLAGSLTAIALAMRLMPVSMVLTSGALVVTALALKMIFGIVKSFAGMSVKDLAKGIIGMGAALAVLAAGLYAMSGTLAGSFALGNAAIGLALLVPAILALGGAKWSVIIKALVALGAALAIIGLAGLLLTPVIPALIGLGAALVLIGGGIFLVGAGIALLGTGIAALAISLPVGVGVMIAAFEELMRAGPRMVKDFLTALLEIAGAIAIIAPQFIKPIVAMIGALAQLIAKAAPKILEVMAGLIMIMVQAIEQNAPKVLQAGITLLISFLQAIRNNITKVVTLVAEIIAKFISALAGKIGSIITAGVNLLVAFLRGITNNLGKVVTAALSIITQFISAISGALTKIATAGLSILTRLLKAIADHLGEAITAGVDVIIAIVKGIGDAGVRLVRAGEKAAGKFIKALAEEIVNLADDVFTAVITLINGMATTIDNRAPELRAAGVRLGWAIINGMTGGLVDKAQGLYNKISEIAARAKYLMTHPWEAFSPSRVMVELGKNIMIGMSLGLEKNAKSAYDSATMVSNGVIDQFNNTFQTASPSKVMMEIGKYVGQGFAIGLKGSGEDINKVFTELNEKLTDAMAKARETIASEEEKLRKLRAAKKPDADAIKEAQKTIALNEELLARSTAGHILLTKALRDEKRELIGLANDYEKISEKLKIARDEMKGLRAEKEAFQLSTEEQMSQTPDISGPMTEEIAAARKAIADEQGNLEKVRNDVDSSQESIVAAQESLNKAQEAFNSLVAGKVLDDTGNSVNILATYLQDLKNQSTAVEAYNSTLKQLRSLGIDDKTYDKLVREGTVDQSFANMLLSGGKTAVQGLNKLDGQIKKNAHNFSVNAANELKNAGIASKQGLINGLLKDEHKLVAAMEEIAGVMVRSLKKALGQKSPSKVFAEIGVDSMRGMAIGLSQGTKIVTDAVVQASADAVSAMKKTMSNISDTVMSEMNANPVITPVLDLTIVKKQAEELGALTNVVPITAATSYGQASRISGAQNVMQDEQLGTPIGGTSVTFEQNNYSPESLTEIEIYRQTKNQLSQLKSVLAIT